MAEYSLKYNSRNGANYQDVPNSPGSNAPRPDGSMVEFKCSNPDCGHKVNVSRHIYNLYYRDETLCLVCRDRDEKKVS